jgi:hypothetical protein
LEVQALVACLSFSGLKDYYNNTEHKERITKLEETFFLATLKVHHEESQLRAKKSKKIELHY